MRLRVIAIGSLWTLAGACAAADPPRNIIVFVADGCGANTHRAFELWRGEPAAYRGEGWAELSVSTYALRGGPRQARDVDLLSQDTRLIYDPARAWDTTPIDREVGGYKIPFQGYLWLLSTAPDSANTASALFTGVPAFVGAIDVDGGANPTTSLAEAAHAMGMTVGIVTSVPFSHATPAAAAGAHVVSRDLYHDIAHQMLSSGVCDVIAGAGHPGFDDNGQVRTEPAYTFIGPEDWRRLRAGELAPEGRDAWTLVDETERIASLASGDVPRPLLMLARVGQTLQQQRAPRAEAKSAAPGEHGINPGLPTLRDMALAALNGVDDDADGFFLMVEGGAVDWAMHDNQLGRVIEEMTDYHETIETVCKLLDTGERGFDWTDTLVVITADHDHLLYGPESDAIPFQPLEDRGRGELPGYRWLYNSHSNQPVPLFVRGQGSERFATIETKPDRHTDAEGRTFERAGYFHQSEIGRVLHGLIAERSGVGARE